MFDLLFLFKPSSQGAYFGRVHPVQNVDFIEGIRGVFWCVAFSDASLVSLVTVAIVVVMVIIVAVNAPAVARECVLSLSLIANAIKVVVLNRGQNIRVKIDLVKFTSFRVGGRTLSMSTRHSWWKGDEKKTVLGFVGRLWVSELAQKIRLRCESN